MLTVDYNINLKPHFLVLSLLKDLFLNCIPNGSLG